MWSRVVNLIQTIGVYNLTFNASMCGGQVTKHFPSQLFVIQFLHGLNQIHDQVSCLPAEVLVR